MEVQLLPKFDMDNITTKVKPIFVKKKSLTTNFYLLYINLSKSIVNPLIREKIRCRHQFLEDSNQDYVPIIYKFFKA